MKTVKNILIIVTASLFSSCSKFLDKAPLDSVNSSNFWLTEVDATSAINGAYQPLQWPKLYNLRIWTTDIWGGNSIVGAGGGTDGIETQDIANFVTATDNAAALDIWRGPAPGILRANLILENVPGMNINEALKNRILGEAHFLRASYYFILVRLFGDVPLITKAQKPSDNLRPTRNSKTEIYNLIIDDFTQAINLLPPKTSYTGADIGRASKGAAAGMLAKVYLTLGQYQQTLDLCQQVSSLGYTLNANYSDNFNPLAKNSPESLFEVQYEGKTNFSFWDNENQSSWVSTFTGPRNSDFVAGGYGWNQPTQEFVNAYEPNDNRKDQTILYTGCPPFDGKAYQASYSVTGFNVRKFLVSKNISPDYDTNPADFPVLRYSDVLLMQAEALNELGKTAEAQQASTSINQGGPLNRVRRRAGLPDVTGLSQTALRAKILHERRMELAFEGHWWFDLVRVNNGQYGLDFLQSIGKTNATTKHLLLPIPQKEIEANPNLSQNTGY
ncbi:RagB/SusD family nutrient uptake outer membrane protein [Terrimonas sp. NA20]|uniref:RagB/SusD family nutrient uptake outer membrane protein n=1 Tax=Terrimonas ginsenosidimutans TaxID=2908004 RepID=A0ABS9KS06_9BACT|nr:RagB/SusD family nutrient uptake outer membrane protein [Terrimonas ginsenosidimutans]MCG2615109.1 RagB/SusD family nutrient uptake outer membrane protein [Terrimonas ginsenosidimutans]